MIYLACFAAGSVVGFAFAIWLALGIEDYMRKIANHTDGQEQE
jgi:hypothetical protein